MRSPTTQQSSRTRPAAAGTIPPLGREGEPPCAALVIDTAAITRHGTATAFRVRQSLAQLLGHGIDITLMGAGGLGVGRVVRGTGPAALDDVLADLAERGIGLGTVVVLADAHSGLGRAASRKPRLRRVSAREALHFLHAQQVGLRAGRVPAVDADPQWVVQRASADRLRQRIDESVLTLGAHGLGTRGALEEDGADTVPMVLAAGRYEGTGPDEHLVVAPDWTGADVDPAPEHDRRLLDLRSGLLAREEAADDGLPVRSLRFVSATHPGVVGLRVEGSADRVHAAEALRGARPEDSAVIAVSTAQRCRRAGAMRTVERVAAYATADVPTEAHEVAAERLAAARQRGFEALLAEHRAEWARRWDVVDVRIPDDPAAQLAIRYALFQLWSNANRHDELAVGARGLSGPGYRGHVFWDADVFVLPAMASVDPAAARAMVQYRLNRLGPARAAAAACGREGARFPWESASSGADVTPLSGDLGGRSLPIRTGTLEEHITADVAWAAERYLSWTGDHTARARFAPLLLDTARYWASRCRVDDAGRAHIDDVIGPDEYHEDVTDNAFTNVMARWNLRAGAAAGRELGVDDRVLGDWLDLADALVDGLDARTGVYEQFTGYFDLEPLLMRDVAPVPVAADLLLGHDRVAATQLIKQPDVLMLHHLVPDEVIEGSLRANLDFYGPRTAHGSSLSPAVTAGLLARAGRPDEALDMLRHALDVDLADPSGLTAAGLHMANLGGTWQAVLGGFAGVTVRAGVLGVDPHLPSRWGSLEVRFRGLGRAVRLAVDDQAVTLDTDGPLRLRVGTHPVRVVDGHVRIPVAARELVTSTSTGDTHV